MRALCVKSFIQIIFRRNMLLRLAVHSYFHTSTYVRVFRLTNMLLTSNTLRNTHRHVIDMGEICTIGIKFVVKMKIVQSCTSCMINSYTL